MVVSQVAIPKNWIKCILLSQKNKQRVVVAEHRAQCRDEGMDEGRRGASAPTSHWQGLKETELPASHQMLHTQNESGQMTSKAYWGS